ncbi:MAG: alpha/beta hydrolase, partial [Gemmatimonadetes bacterium]|nr:alpha/beta hydrolase [Gemmatimonadota bacterium]
PPPGVEHPFGITDPVDAAWVRASLTPHPVKTFTDRVRLGNPRADSIPRTYIRCPLRAHPGPDTLSHHAHAARRSPGWRYREIPSDHDPMITHPRELTALLLEVA